MEKGFVDVIFILDMSGSMHSLSSDVVGGFNSFIEKIKKVDANQLVTTVLFNTSIHTLHNRIPVGKLKELTHKEYSPNGCTALLDAIGTTIDRFDLDYKEAKPEKTLMYIYTDGMENSSSEYNYKMIKKMIKWHTEKESWEISFLASNIDEERIAEDLGISRDRAFSYEADMEGCQKFMDDIAEDVCYSLASVEQKKMYRKITDKKKPRKETEEALDPDSL